MLSPRHMYPLIIMTRLPRKIFLAFLIPFLQRHPHLHNHLSILCHSSDVKLFIHNRLPHLLCRVHARRRRCSRRRRRCIEERSQEQNCKATSTFQHTQQKNQENSLALATWNGVTSLSSCTTKLFSGAPAGGKQNSFFVYERMIFT